jgi:hypothetical protein
MLLRLLLHGSVHCVSAVLQPIDFLCSLLWLCVLCVCTVCVLSAVLQVTRPSWSKVRWINVQGLSWDVITTLAVAFDLHPLVRAAAAAAAAAAGGADMC